MQKRMTGTRALMLAVMAGVGLAVVAYVGREPLARRLAQRWQCQLDTAADEREVTLLLWQIEYLGKAGVPSLVATLGSPKDNVARAGRRALLEQLDRWKSLEVADSEPKLTSLAKALAEQVSGFGPAARGDAAELAVRILREFPEAARGRVVAACEEVLRTTAPERGQLVIRQLSDGPGDASGSTTRLASHIDEVPPEPPVMPGRIKSVELLSEPVAASSLAVDGLLLQLPADHFPGGVGPDWTAPADRQAWEGRFGSGDSRTVADPASSFRRTEGGGLAQGETPAEAGFAGGNRTAAASGTASPPSTFVHVETVELMRQLQAGGAEQAETELRRRGFNDVQLELARQLFDRDPRVRKCLVERLPSLQSVNVVPWLLQLCRDEDSEVRRAAVAWIATTGDPSLRAEAERLARQDADPRLRDQAERIAKQGSRMPR